MKHILALVALLAATPAMAQSMVHSGKLVVPPVEYDYPYKGPIVIEKSTSQEYMKANCSHSSLGYIVACQRRVMGGCWVLIMDDDFLREKGWTKEFVMRHEIAHCNGWPGDHRGARPISLSDGNRK